MNWLIPVVFASSIIPLPPVEPVINQPLTEKIEVSIPTSETIVKPEAPQQATQPLKIECSCVMYIRSKGIPMPTLYDARNLDITLNSPPIRGGLVKMKYGEVYHLAYVESIDPDGINISEQNFSKDPTCPVTYRKIKFDDPAILGFARSGYPMK